MTWQGDMRHETQDEYFGKGVVRSMNEAAPWSPCAGERPRPPAVLPQFTEQRIDLTSVLMPDGAVLLYGAKYRYDGDQWVVEL